MHAVTGGLLASKVTEAGGLGLIGVGYSSRDWLKVELNNAKKDMFGVGFISWRLAEHPDLLDLALESKPRAIWLSFGDISPLVEKIKKAKVPLICQVQNGVTLFVEKCSPRHSPFRIGRIIFPIPQGLRGQRY